MTDDLAGARREPSRIEFLDGLRGFGALSVVLHHFTVLLAPLLGVAAVAKTSWAVAGPMLLVTNGPFYVKVFFVLSGFVLANSVASGRTPLAASVVMRYLRLTVPMTVALLCTCLIGALFPHPGLVLVPDPSAALGLGLYGVYLHGAPSANFALWTMQFELVGSLLIYLCYKLPVRFRMASLFLLAALSLFRTNGLGFAVGAIIREFYAEGKWRSPVWTWSGLLIYLFVCSGGEFLAAPDAAQNLREHNFLPALLETAGAAGLILFVLTAGPAQGLLRSRPAQFLAHVSFGLYLIHFPLMFPLAWMGSHMSGPLSARLGCTFILFVGTAIALGWLLTILVDDPLILLLKRGKKKWPARLTIPPRSP